ncbi:neuroplastin-like [Mya arenaria]|uniref:neuroplastin-like n=1 Tax=Mya arenaria TaxID=6604 RepID=UPI0022E56EF1|nr:neuroplastin-like [Mya arenaria]
MPEVELRCTLSGIGPATVFEFEWKGPDGKLLEGDRFKNFHGNGTLVINKPTRADMGEYHCTVVFNPKNEKEKHSITPKPVFLYAGPAIVSNDNNKNMVEGDKLELKCEVTGYPTPTIGWYKGDQVLNTTITIQFDKYKGIDNGKLVIFELGYDDAGKYKCEAMNDYEPFIVEAVMEVRVKDKLAALWPFLGIVAEVVILCVIILVYEKRRSKKLAEEDETDGPTENTVDHKDVRHRRT